MTSSIPLQSRLLGYKELADLAHLLEVFLKAAFHCP